MPSKQLYLSMGLGVVIAIAILISSTQLYTNIAPTVAPSNLYSDTGTLGKSIIGPESVAAMFSIVKQEATVVLVYVEYVPAAKEVKGIRLQVSGLKFVFEDEGELIVPGSLILMDEFVLDPGEKELVAAVPIYPATLTRVELSLSGSVSVVGGQEEPGPLSLTWVGNIQLMPQKPVIIILTII